MDKIVYILINEAMPGYVKIGQTTNLEQRIRSLDTTSVPLPFECFYACTVQDADFVERQVHDTFSDRRVRSSREFFEVSPDRVVSALKLAEIENVTPKSDYVGTSEDQQALDKARKRRENFNFRMVGIPVGAELSFMKDENIKAKVVDNRRIEVDGEVTSLTASAQKLLDRPYLATGPEHWTYEGERLSDRRSRLEAEE